MPEEKYLQDASAKIADQVLYRREIESVGPTEEMQADIVGMILQRVNPPLMPQTMAKLLHDLSVRSEEAYHRLMRLAKYKGLGALLKRLGVAESEIVAHWDFNWADALQLVAGIAAGVLYALGEAAVTTVVMSAVLIVVAAIGTLLGPELSLLFAYVGLAKVGEARLRQAFGVAKKVFDAALKVVKHPVVTASEFLAEKRTRIESSLLSGDYFEAGRTLGELGVDVALTLMPLKDLGKLVKLLVPRMRKLSRSLIRELKLAELLLHVNLKDISTLSKDGWEIIKIPNDRFIVRSPGRGVAEVEAAELQAAVAEVESHATSIADGAGGRGAGTRGGSEARGTGEGTPTLADRGTPPRPLVGPTVGYQTLRGQVIGRLQHFPDAPYGTARFGSDVESELGQLIHARFPQTEFGLNTGVGNTGVDVTWIGGENPGFHIADFKPDTKSGFNKFVGQVRRLWSGGPQAEGSPTFRAAVIMYRPDGTIYIGDIATVAKFVRQ
jgi:hypothetical protein